MADTKIDQILADASALAALLEFDRNRQRLIASAKSILENPYLNRLAADEVAGTVNALRGLVGLSG